jgi:hypothetical protein
VGSGGCRKEGAVGCSLQRFHQTGTEHAEGISARGTEEGERVN